jgi:2-polyprenyl-3-methyl-5-hydroxy-6-metoxy-1,4-benzoquinol methylase
VSIYDVCNAAGGMSAYEWERDPKRLLFILARYKFVARMLEGKHMVLEVGCADGFGSRIVRQHVEYLDAMDIDENAIAIAESKCSKVWSINYFVGDIFAFERKYPYDAVYALDLYEHIDPEQSELFLHHMHSLAPVCIIGTPSRESQPYASELSKQGHINCVTAAQLKARCGRYWSQVFIFCMNDEMLHTGFHPMAHYLFALCVK